MPATKANVDCCNAKAKCDRADVLAKTRFLLVKQRNAKVSPAPFGKIIKCG
jgi:hypothetical protein